MANIFLHRLIEKRLLLVSIALALESDLRVFKHYVKYMAFLSRELTFNPVSIPFDNSMQNAGILLHAFTVNITTWRSYY